jgi:threonine dehydratase
MAGTTDAAPVTAADVVAAQAAIGDVTRHTPVLPSATLSERCGGDVLLKAESLQRAGSFKIRGALSKLHALGDGCARGVVCGSAGNQGQAQIGRVPPCEN